MNATRYIYRMHLRIRILTALGILITALLSGLATTLPFYQASRSGMESITRLSVEAQADAVHHQLGRFQDIANQLTGRTEIRRRLVEYARGELSREAATAYITPRLEDAMAQAPDVAGLVRLGPNGEEISRIGRAPAIVQRSSVPREGYPCSFHPMEDGELLLQACAPLHSDDGEQIGSDLVYFSAEVLQSLLSRNERLGNHAVMRLRASSGEHDLTLDATGFSLMPSGTHSHHTSAERDIAFNVPIGDQGWRLLAEVPTQRFHEEAIKLMLWPVLIILALAGGGALLVSHALQPLLARVARQARRLEQSEQELRLAASVFRHAREAILITDQHHAIVEANPAFTQLTGHPAEPLIGRSITELLTPKERLEEATQRVLETLGRQDVWQGEVHYQRANGDILVALQTISAVRDADGTLLRHIHIFNDISAQKAAEEEIRHQAFHDELTGLPNRSLLMERLERAIHRVGQGEHRLAVLFLDLDNFKRVNDTLGHQAGDELLKQVARRLDSHLRERDTLARLGGDEFVVVLEGLSRPAPAARVAEGLIEALLEPFTVAGERVEIGVSVGAALYTGDGADGEALLKAADVAMYRAKDAGRNTWRLHDRTLDEVLRASAPP